MYVLNQQEFIWVLKYFFKLEGNDDQEYDKAISLFSDSNENCADHHVTWHNMGMCYEYKNDFENAKRCYKKVIQYLN